MTFEQAKLKLVFIFMLAMLSPVAFAGPACHELFDQAHLTDDKSRPEIYEQPKDAAVANIFKVIDQLATSFRGTNSFTSPREWRRQGAAFGLPGLDLPKSLGGRDLPASEMIRIFNHAGEYALDLRDVIGGGHSRPLVQSNEPEVLEIVKQVARGEGYMAIAITEENYGSNMRAMKSVSMKVEGGYRLTGEKLYNARFENATHVIIFTQNSAGSKGKLNAFVLPIDYPGLSYTKLEAHGLLGNSFGGVKFDDVFVPEKYRLGADGEGGKVFRNHFLYWRLMMSAAAVGTGQGALKQVAERLRSRKAFGGAIGRFTHLQQPLAEYTAKLHMANLLVQQAATLIDQGKYDEAAPLVSMAKAEGVEFALEAADYAMRTFGAEGYSSRVDLSQRVADLQGLRIADGTTDVMRADVVRQIYGSDLWDMAIGKESK